MENKPYKIEFTSVPSYNNDGAEWYLYEVRCRETNGLLTGPSRQGTKAEITKHVHEVMAKRKGSITCHDKSQQIRLNLSAVRGLPYPIDGE